MIVVLGVGIVKITLQHSAGRASYVLPMLEEKGVGR
jgi:hypothetical protein